MPTVKEVEDALTDSSGYLDRQLAEARRRIKRVDVVTGAAVVAVGAISYVLSVIILDQLLVLSTWSRLGLLAAFSAATLGYLFGAVILPASRRISLLYAAKAVEEADPATKNSLINWLLLRHRAGEVPESVLKAIERRAARDVARIDLEDAIQSKRLLQVTYVLAAVVVAFCAFSFFTTKALSTSLQRVLFPLAEIAPPTQTRLTDIEPGSVEIPAGETVTLSAFVSGKPPESVTAYVSSDAGAFWEPNPLTPPSEKYGRWQASLHDRQRSFDYYLVANDFKSPIYQVRVTAAPMIAEWKTTYHFPAYTGLPPRTESTGDIDGLEGSRVEIEATTNVPVSENSGKLDLKLARQETTVPMSVVSGAENKLKATITLSEEGSYRIRFSDLLGRAPQFRPVKTIRVRRDLAPQVSFVEPKAPEVEVPSNATVPFRIAASDDFGLRRVRFVLEKQDSDVVLAEREFGRPDEPLGKSQLLVLPVGLEKHGLKKGDILLYWAEALDNRMPVYNATSTRPERRLILITDPAPPEKEPQQLAKNEPREKQVEPSPDQEQEPSQEKSDEQKKDSPEQEGEGQGQSKDAAGAQDKSESTQASTRQKDGGAEGKGEPADSAPPPTDEEKRDLEKLKRFFDEKDQEKQPSKEQQRKADDATKDEKPSSTKEQERAPRDSSDPSSADGERKERSEESPSGTRPKSDRGDSPKREERGGEEKSPPKNDQRAAKEGPREKKQEARDAGERAQRKEERGSEKPSGEEKQADAPANGGDPKDAAPDEKTKDEGRAPKKDAPGKRDPSGESPANKDDGKSAKESPERRTADDKSAPGAPREQDDSKLAEEKAQPNSPPAPDGSPGEKDSLEKKDGDSAAPKDAPSEKPGAAEKPGAPDKAGEDKADDQRPERASKNEKTDGGRGKKDQASKARQETADKPSDPSQAADSKQQRPNDEGAEEGLEKKEQGGEPGSESKQKDAGSSDEKAKKSANQKTGREESATRNKDGSAEESQSSDKTRQEKASSGQEREGSKSEEKPNGRAGDPRGSEKKSEEQDPTGRSARKDSRDGERDQGQGQQRPGGQEKKDAGEGGGQGKDSQEPDKPGESGARGSGEKRSPKEDSSKKSGSDAAKDGGESGKAGEEKKQGDGKGAPSGEEQSPSDKSSSSSSEKSSKGSSKSSGESDAEPKGPSDAGDAAGSTADKPAGNGKRGAEEPPPGKIIDNTGEKADPDDRRRATQLTLKRLEEELKNKKVDPELLKQMGWTEEDARKFAERMSNKLSPELPPAEKISDPLVGKARSGFGEGTNLRKTVGRASSGAGQDDVQGLEQSRRTAPPPELRELYEAYTRSLSKTPAKSAPAPGPEAKQK